MLVTATTRFRDANPKAYRAFFAALSDAIERIDAAIADARAAFPVAQNLKPSKAVQLEAVVTK